MDVDVDSINIGLDMVKCASESLAKENVELKREVGRLLHALRSSVSLLEETTGPREMNKIGIARALPYLKSTLVRSGVLSSGAWKEDGG